MPASPAPLHTRNTNEMYHDTPSTPTRGVFTSPQQTPQGSPSKNQAPPGAYDLPNVFENAMKLLPTFGTPSKNGQNAQSPTRHAYDVDTGANGYLQTQQAEAGASPGSPTRKGNKENTPPNQRPSPKKESSFISQAASSRDAIYKTREAENSQPSFHTQRGLSREDLDKLAKPGVKRLANVTQLYFLDYYYDLLTYVHGRQNRLAQFKAAHPAPQSTPDPEYEAALNKYLGRERANLRKRRTRLRHGDFQILTQVGQGGYGQVYLAQKKDTREVCALKVMSKKLLFKLDEVRHVLTERDILTTAKSEWLVRLLYAFQDDKSIYLAMVG